MGNGHVSISFMMEGLEQRMLSTSLEYVSDEIRGPHTLSISLKRIGSCLRIALMHTGSPLKFPFQISVNPVSV